MVAIYLFTKVQEQQTPAQKLHLTTALTAEFPNSWRDIGNDNYLVATGKPLITQDVTKLAGVTEGQAGAYIVTNTDPYFGWANRAIWEWMTTMRELHDRS